MAAAVLSVFLALALTIAVHRPPDATPEATPGEIQADKQTPAPVLPIEIIDGEIWVAIEVEGMPDDLH